MAIRPPSRREFLTSVGVGTVGLMTARPAALAAIAHPSPTDTGSTSQGSITMPAIVTETEPQDKGPPNPFPPEKRLGFAIVGLGRLSLENILPAFGASKYAKIAALVSGTPDKMDAVASQYGVSKDHCYNYETFDRIVDDKTIDVVYIVLPNSLHHEYVLRAAKSGKHILCEKPMAVSSAEAREMISVCAAAERKLMIAYRMQYEPHNREVTRLVRAGEFGKIRLYDGLNMQAQGDLSQWRLSRAMSGGGSLVDVGIYCLNTIRSILGEEPIEVSAEIYSDPLDPRFKEVEDVADFRLKFPSGVIANCTSSYSAHQHRSYRIFGDKGYATLDPAFGYEGQKLKTTQKSGKDETISEIQKPSHNQFALEIDHMAECVWQKRTPRTPGEEGLQDQTIIEAIYESAKTKRPVALSPGSRVDATRGPALEDN